MAEGDRLVELRALGKHLLMRFGSGRTLHSHLRMQGAWRVHRMPPRGHRVTAWFDFGEPEVLVAHAMPVLDVARATRSTASSGTWALTSCPRTGRARSSPSSSSRGGRIREALLDQSNLCGIGNLWAVEGLFVAGVWPHAPVADVEVARVLDLNARTGCTGGTDVPCRRCGTPIAFTRAGADPSDRETWWCRTASRSFDRSSSGGIQSAENFAQRLALSRQHLALLPQHFALLPRGFAEHGQTGGVRLVKLEVVVESRRVLALHLASWTASRTSPISWCTCANSPRTSSPCMFVIVRPGRGPGQMQNVPD